MDKKNKRTLILWTSGLIILGILFGLGVGYNIGIKQGTKGAMNYFIETYGDIEEMDNIVLLLQTHCLVDLMNGYSQKEFCDALLGENELDDNIIDLYKFKS